MRQKHLCSVSRVNLKKYDALTTTSNKVTTSNKETFLEILNKCFIGTTCTVMSVVYLYFQLHSIVLLRLENFKASTISYSYWSYASFVFNTEIASSWGIKLLVWRRGNTLVCCWKSNCFLNLSLQNQFHNN